MLFWCQHCGIHASSTFWGWLEPPTLCGGLLLQLGTAEGACNYQTPQRKRSVFKFGKRHCHATFVDTTATVLCLHLQRFLLLASQCCCCSDIANEHTLLTCAEGLISAAVLCWSAVLQSHSDPLWVEAVEHALIAWQRFPDTSAVLHWLLQRYSLLCSLDGL